MDQAAISFPEWRARKAGMPVTDVADRTPLERVAAGDERAMADCIDAYGGLVWGLARRWLGDGENAEDAVQDVFVELWRSAGRFDPSKASDRGFVAMLARRRLIDRRRKLERRITTTDLAGGLHIGTTEHERTEGRVMAAPALAALDTLPDDRREFVFLSVVHGMSHSEVAEATGVPLGTVKSGIRRGLRAMRDVLSEQGIREVGR